MYFKQVTPTLHTASTYRIALRGWTRYIVVGERHGYMVEPILHWVSDIGYWVLYALGSLEE